MDDSRDVAGGFQPGRFFFLPIFAASSGRGGCVVFADGVDLHCDGRQPSFISVGHGSALWSGTDAGGGDSALQCEGGRR